MTMSPEQYAKRMDEAIVKVPRPAPVHVKATLPQLAASIEDKLKAANRG